MVMGAVTVSLGVTGTMIPAPGSSLVGVMQAHFQNSLVGFFSTVESTEVYSLLGTAVLLIASVLVVRRYFHHGLHSV